MAQIVLDLPDELVARLRAEAEAKHTTAEALLARHVAAKPPETPEAPIRTAASFWGVGVGRPGTHESVEAIDASIRELRDEWDD